MQSRHDKQIADRLQISESTVKASLQQLFAKTGVRTRSQLVRIALEQFRNQLQRLAYRLISRARAVIFTQAASLPITLNRCKPQFFR